MARLRAVLVALGLVFGGVVGTAQPAQAAMPAFQMPFPCGEVWYASTYSGHGAIDWNAYPGDDTGRTVVASAAGTASLFYEPIGGYQVIIDHGSGWKTVYAHLQQNDRVSGAVAAGDTIGRVGSTGSGVTGAHLHWEQIHNGNKQTPLVANGSALSPGVFPASTAYTSNNCASTAPPPPPPPVRPSFQSDKFGDMGILHQLSDGGFDAHVLYGSTGTPFQYNPTIARRFSGTDDWDWSKIKTSAGDYNGDGYTDIAAAHKLSDGGADIHVLWGGAGTPFTYPNTSVRRLSGSDGWSWDDMKLESGRFQVDKYYDLAILHRIADGGFDAHVLYGSSGTPFQYNPTTTERFSGADDWDWSKIKTSAGDYNGDDFDDIAVAHELADGGAGVHVLWGGAGIPFTYPQTAVRQLPATDDWDWDKMKLESGRFQVDKYSDLAILHELSDGGFDAHVLYGSTGTPFQYNPTTTERFEASDGWTWSKIKTTVGDYNGDDFDDIGIAHQLADDGAGIHVLWGGPGIPFTYPQTAVRQLPASDDWSWSKMKLEGR